MDGSSLIFCGIEFQIVGAANLKALRPTALAVKGTCNRLVRLMMCILLIPRN